jgi:NAD(P)-dependent dehydrogenase (short-subunit alcohol dehydrogenase family)
MTPFPLTVLTGASRGMGRAMAEQLVHDGHHLLCLSRQSDPELSALAPDRVTQWAADLSAPADAAQRLGQWLDMLAPERVSAVTLINNAGVIAEIAPLEDCPLAEQVQALRVGLEAPMLLTSAFLHSTRRWVEQGWRGPRKVLNISSGLGRHPMASQAPYCAAKAGMDNFSRCCALDQAQQAHGAKVVSLAPGVIATDMQVQLRQGDPSRFPDRQRFVQLHNNGLLSTPDESARAVLAYLNRPDFGDEVVADVRN